MKKKLIALLLIAAFALTSLAACKSTSETPAADASGEKLKVVTTIFPVYDWVRSILGDKAADADITMLLDGGVDLHSYQPTADDIMTIGNADVFVYVGGESDEWVEDALKEAVNKDMKVINLLDSLGDAVKEEEVVEGMQAEDHEHEEDEDHEHEEGPEYDEHVWLSLKNTRTLVSVIASALEEADPENKDDYETNKESYIAQLDDLDARYQAAVDAGARKVLLFGDRFPFRYLTDDYGLTYFAAFVGCSAETEASFETIAYLSAKMDELQLPYICRIETGDGKIANSIIQSTTAKNQQILTFDSLQSTTSSEVQSGKTYLSVMESNLTVLTTALS